MAPVEFIFIGKQYCDILDLAFTETCAAGVLLAKMRNCSWEDRAGEVLALRRCTREAHKDVRSNQRVMKTMWDFISNVSIGTADPYEGWERPGVEDDDPPPKKKAVTKRKRQDDDKTEDPKVARRTSKPRLKQEPLSNGVRFVA